MADQLLAMKREERQRKSAGVVCVTYRNPEKPSIVREFGLVSLVEEMFQQDHSGDITLSIVDSSPNPHPYLEIVSKRFPNKVIYTHIPDRDQAAKQSCKETFIPNSETLREALALYVHQLQSDQEVVPQELTDLILSENFSDVDPNVYGVLIGREGSSGNASKDIISQITQKYPYSSLTNDNTVFWNKRLQETKDIAGFVPFEDDYPIQTNIFSQIFSDRPTIGMKKNYGVQALVDSGACPHAIVFSDDDDHHAPDYVAKSMAALGNNDFTRMTRYITHIFNASHDNKPHEWGIFDLRIQKDGNDFWRLDPQQTKETMHNLYPDGAVHNTSVGGKFSRLVTMAWPILSHEGALHTYSYNAWKKSVDAFGGCIPVSFCEDIILYRKFKDTFGADFKDVHTPIVKGEESFIRIADGGNASVIEWMEQNSDVPQWAQDSVQELYSLKNMKPCELAANLRQRAEKLTL